MATQNRFVKVDGGFERIPALGTPEYTQYLVAQGRSLGVPGIEKYATPPQNTGTRTLEGATSNAPGSPLPVSNTSVSTSAQATSPYDSFNLILGGMLKKAQGFSTADLLKRKRELERSAIGRSTKPTDEDIRTLSPDQQRAVRSGEISALRPEIDANAYEIEKAEQNIDNFFRVYKEAKSLGQEWADKMVAPDSIIENARKVIEARPEAMSTVLAGFNDKTKEKILGSLDYSKLGEKGSDVNGTIVEVGGKKLLINSKTGETIKDLGAVGGGEGGFKAELAKSGRQAVATLLKIAEDNPDIFGRSAAVYLPEAFRSNAFRNYEAQLDSLKGNIIPAALTAMREASKTGGALGAVSDREGAWLSAALGALSMTQDPKQVIEQLRQIDKHLQIWEDAVDMYGGGNGEVTGGMIRMKGPGGTFDVPADKVETFKQNGYQAI